MADWDGLRHDLEGSVVTPPLTALRERRRRRQQRRAIAATFAVVLVGTAGGVAVLGQAEQRRNGGPTAALDVVVNSEDLAPPKDYEDPVVTDVDFVTRDVGWAIGLRCVGDTCDVSTWRTGDGGRTWSAPSVVAVGVPRLSFREQDPAGGAVRSLRMVDERHGFAFNPALYVTSDGGQTWQRQDQRSKATSIGVAGDTYWVAERGCANGIDCDLVVRTATVGSTDLRPMAGLPETNGAAAIVRRAGVSNGYVVTWGAPKAAFYATADGGETWGENVNPCPDATAEALSAGSGRPLWLVCTTPAGRTAFQSEDHGATWRPLAAPPADGVVTDLVARTAQDAYLTTQQPARLFVTSDGGTTWQQADGTATNGYGYGNLDVVDPTHSWAMGDEGILWRTTDGRRWERLALPPGAPRVTATPSTPAPTTAAPQELVEWTGISFTDQVNGWALGRSCVASQCHALLRRTHDSGKTWSVAPAPAATFADGVGGAGVQSVLFADHRIGYLYGPELWLTEDGGAHWTSVETDGNVRQLVLRDGYAWTVETDGCQSQECFAAIRRGYIGVDDFTTVLRGGDEMSIHQSVGLAAVNRDVAYAYTSDLRGGPPSAIATTDGGRTWSARKLPCAEAIVRTVAAPWRDELWMMCGYEGGGGQQPHRTAHSTDGGVTWNEVASSDGTGYLALFRELSPSVGWRADGGIASGIKVTSDGGRSWTEAVVPESVRGGGGPYALEMIDGQVGFALFFDGVFLRMTDGRTWEAMATPPGAGP